jgi:hypothetical protein
MTSQLQAACRSCGAPDPTSFLSLGELPLPDDLIPARRLGEPQERYPLEVAFCPRCSLVQLVGDVPAERMFVENYLYFSSFSDHVLRHSEAHALELIADRELGAGSSVVEIASNDGYLLRNFVEAGVPALGVDPSPEPVAAAWASGIPTLLEFFGREVAERILAENGPADVIIANNVMAHVPDLDDFLGGMTGLLADEGLITVENAYVRDLIDHVEFDTIYHEHVCYYSCTSVDRLVALHGLFLNHVREFPDLHGGTLRWYISKRPGRSRTLRRFLAAEERAGLTDLAYYTNFGARVEEIRAQLSHLLTELRGAGHSIAAYGAAAKGTVLLNYVGIDEGLIDFVVDRNMHKHGRYMPGVRIPIAAPGRLLEDQPDYTLLLAWNFTDEIVEQQREYARRGGRFIRPIPAPAVLEPEALTR